MKILLVDDDKDSRNAVAWFLADQGHEPKECSSAEEAMKAFVTDDYPMVLTDIKLPGMSGIDFLRKTSSLIDSRKSDFVLFTGYGNMKTAIEALRAGAYDYLLKPIDAQELDLVVQKIEEHQVLLRENDRLTSAFEAEVEGATKETKQEINLIRRNYNDSVIGQVGAFSRKMRGILEVARKYHTERSIPVLIEGETGTGKEIIARVIHYRDDGHGTVTPFIDINCAALAPSLIESELFGYEPGAFSGSLAKGQRGKIDAAAGGTLFLDEIGELQPELQAKLLRVIQEKEYYRVGGIKKIKTDVRIICATNIDLETKVKEGAFRRDLYYRLKVGHIILPPLRERSEEVVPLAKMFLKYFSRRRGKRFKDITPAACSSLTKYHWPGNIRELKNAVDWMVFMFDAQELSRSHVEKALAQGERDAEINTTNDPELNDQIVLPLLEGGHSLKEYTNDVVRQVLRANNNHREKTAKYLGMTIRALGYRLDKMRKFH